MIGPSRFYVNAGWSGIGLHMRNVPDLAAFLQLATAKKNKKAARKVRYLGSSKSGH
jgi:hypothetical protein